MGRIFDFLYCCMVYLNVCMWKRYLNLWMFVCPLDIYTSLCPTLLWSYEPYWVGHVSHWSCGRVCGIWTSLCPARLTVDLCLFMIFEYPQCTSECDTWTAPHPAVVRQTGTGKGRSCLSNVRCPVVVQVQWYSVLLYVVNVLDVLGVLLVHCVTSVCEVVACCMWSLFPPPTDYVCVVKFAVCVYVCMCVSLLFVCV